MDILKKLGITPINQGGSCGRQWYSGSGNALLTSLNPSNNEILAKVQQINHADYQTIVNHSQEVFKTWRMVPAPRRGELVRLIGQALREHKDVLGSLVSLEMGKSKQEGDGEVQEMIDMADMAVGQARMLHGLTMHSERPQHRMYEQWHPIGPVGVISAFNFPVAVWAWNAFVAAIAGNTVIWKPAAKTPLCAIAVQHLCNQVAKSHGFPEVFSLIIPESHELAEIFVNDKRIPLISFTGSTLVGQHVAKLVAARLGRSLLELGGNNAIIVDKTAHLAVAIPAIVFGAVGTAGQRCTTTRRLFVHKDIYDAVIPRLISAYKQVTVGDPLNSKNLMGPLIDKSAVTHFERAIAELKSMGGEILHGGHKMEGKGNFVTPTIALAENHWPVVQRETFAPILYVMKYNTLDEAIALQNGVVQGLSSAIFTDSIQIAEQFLSTVGSDCGIANVNIGTSGAEIGGAFGGEKETGGGREAGSDAWKAYMRRQTNTINWGNALPLAQGIQFNVGS